MLPQFFAPIAMKQNTTDPIKTTKKTKDPSSWFHNSVFSQKTSSFIHNYC
jgi:hypothetical protein